MTNITELAEELRDLVAWQRTPEPVTEDDYLKMIIYGIKTLLIDTGRASQWTNDLLQTGDTDGDDAATQYLKMDLPLDEQRYALLTAEINFFKRVQSDVNNIVGYTTDALSVTNADKPYAHLQDTIANLENERRIVFYKMVSYSFYQG